jgi:hypothetical protein
MVPLAVVTAVAMLVGWFPATAIWHQQSQLNTTSAQITAIENQERALSLQAKSIDSKSAAILLAREQYQLVSPGQSLIQVLPGVGANNANPNTGDPGLQPLVSPSSVSSLATPTAPTSSKDHSSAKAFLSRLVRTLEFWR